MGPGMAPDDYHSVDSDQQKDLKMIRFTVKVEDLYKFTKEMKEYDQKSRDDFKTFESKLSSVIKKLAASSGVRVTWSEVIEKEVVFDQATEDLLVTLYDDFLVKAADEDTREDSSRFLRS